MEQAVEHTPSIFSTLKVIEQSELFGLINLMGIASLDGQTVLLFQLFGINRGKLLDDDDGFPSLFRLEKSMAQLVIFIYPRTLTKMWIIHFGFRRLTSIISMTYHRLYLSQMITIIVSKVAPMMGFSISPFRLFT